MRWRGQVSDGHFALATNGYGAGRVERSNQRASAERFRVHAVLGLQIGRDGEQFVELSTNKHLQISFRQNLKILAGLAQFILKILTFKELSDVPETGHTLALLRG